MAISRPEDANAKPLAANAVSNASQAARYQPGGADFSGQLENASLLEAPRVFYVTSLKPSVILQDGNGIPEVTVPSTGMAPLETELGRQSPAPLAAGVNAAPPQVQPITEQLPNTTNTTNATNATTPTVASATIPLLEERLVIGLHRRKVGEVIIRKEIETRLVQVPVRREKLIVEKISPEYEQLAVVDLGQQGTEVDAVEAANSILPSTLRGEFSSVKAAVQFLEAIAAHSGGDAQKVQLGVVLQDTAMQAMAQRWLEQYAAQKAATASS